MDFSTSRRRILTGSAIAALGSTLSPRLLYANDAISIGSLTPNTGGGAPYGGNMAAAIRRTVDQINASGGVLNRQIKLTQEDGETNPETATRAADKLINVNQVIAILGTWASSVTLGIMPKCQSANIIQMCTSSSDDIPIRDTKGLCFNFQILNPVWGRALGKMAIDRGFKQFKLMALNNDFTRSILTGFEEAIGPGRLLEKPFYYNANQASYKAEVSRLLEGNPDAVFIPAYVTDFTSVYKDIYRAGYKGQVITVTFAASEPFKKAVGAAADGILHGFPIPPLDSPAYKQYLQEAGLQDNGQIQHPYGTACRDQISVLALAIEKAGTTEAEAVKRAIYDVSTGPGKKVVYNVLDGLKALRAGEKINYSGAGSAVEFDQNRQLIGRDIQLYQIRNGRDEIIATLKVR
ncbi:MAG: ABC transporter substrate-binding protein [Burkholderiales bacterium]|nr:ABC transporter substrate-binding protein [Burkholderiales bacterium]